jgi:hypothetical protein
VGPVLCFILKNIFGLRPVDPSTLTAADGTTVDERLLMAIEQDTVLAVTNLYPNPVRDILNVQVALELDAQLEITVLNAMGQQVMAPASVQPGMGTSLLPIDVYPLPAGTYFLRIAVGDNVVTERFVKMD